MHNLTQEGFYIYGTDIEHVVFERDMHSMTSTAERLHEFGVSLPDDELMPPNSR